LPSVCAAQRTVLQSSAGNSVNCSNACSSSAFAASIEATISDLVLIGGASPRKETDTRTRCVAYYHSNKGRRGDNGLAKGRRCLLLCLQVNKSPPHHGLN